MKLCEWCESENIQEITNTVYWELPDGSRAIQIDDAPAIECLECGIEYQEEKIIEKIENQLLLVNTKKLAQTLTYESLLKTERILKRNYFDF
ncbi:YokU family protein [Metabacillus arenae]|uniref:YokU family protein n=1 Tax=Metabacillus arenae TaxID=2771434 RepID=A0A926NEM1_9BACI|nr:YokU family protein [Metabacillus arenae]MBD1379048.1 YokU family protein [Metabacillus arenae]